MYKVVIVDDEEWIRQGLVKKIEKSGLNIDGIFAAKDADEGLKIIEKEKPDIVICDIRLQGKDGLELSATVKRIYPHIKIIFISGFDEFDYVKKALQIGAVDFLLKPINNSHLYESLKKCIGLIEKQNNELKTLKSMTVLDQLNEARSKFLKFLNNEEIGLNDIFFDYESHSVFAGVCLYVDNYVSLDKDIALASLYKTMDYWKWNKNIAIYKNNINEYIMVFCLSDHKEEDSYQRLILDLLTTFENQLRSIEVIQYTFGISNFCDSPEIAIAQAGNAMKYRVLIDDNYRINYSDIIDYSNIYTLQTQSEISIKNDIKNHQYKNLSNTVKSIYDVISTSKISYKSLQELYTRLLKIGIDDFNMELENKSCFFPKEAYRFNSLKDMFDFIKNLYLNIINTTYKEDEDYKKELVYRVKDYVDLNYDRKITLDSIAATEHVNFCYLSILFKEILNVNFQDYLMRVRIENAKIFLRTNKYRIKQIALMAGFTEEHYFSKVFKKLEGITPREYVKSFEKSAV